MKKCLFLTGMLLLLSTFTFAQAVEVKGVTSRVAEYNRDRYYIYYGFEYENFNSFAVTVEVTKVNKEDDKIVDTKTFVLQPREKYIWKVGMWVGISNDDPTNAVRYYTKFKAYKLE